MKKIILLILFLLLPSVFAATQTFTNLVKVTTFFVNDTNTSASAFVTIITEQDNHTYNCISNSTNSFNFDLKRNLTDAAELSVSFSNFSSGVNNVFNTCDKIVQQYGDLNRYFTLYTSCNTENELCKRDKGEQKTLIDTLTPFKPNYENCNTALSNAQVENSRINTQVLLPLQEENKTCKADLGNESNKKFLWAIFGALGVGIFWGIEKGKITPGTKRKKIATGLGPRM